jgi:hypothetical protein
MQTFKKLPTIAPNRNKKTKITDFYLILANFIGFLRFLTSFPQNYIVAKTPVSIYRIAPCKI